MDGRERAQQAPAANNSDDEIEVIPREPVPDTPRDYRVHTTYIHVPYQAPNGHVSSHMSNVIPIRTSNHPFDSPFNQPSNHPSSYLSDNPSNHPSHYAERRSMPAQGTPPSQYYEPPTTLAQGAPSSYPERPTLGQVHSSPYPGYPPIHSQNNTEQHHAQSTALVESSSYPPPNYNGNPHSGYPHGWNPLPADAFAPPPPPNSRAVTTFRQNAPRQRTAIACKYCRHRKIRCTGFTDHMSEGKCGNCIKHGQECIFTPVSSQTAFVPIQAMFAASSGRHIGPNTQLYGAHGQPLPRGTSAFEPQLPAQLPQVPTLPPPPSTSRSPYNRDFAMDSPTGSLEGQSRKRGASEDSQQQRLPPLARSPFTAHQRAESFSGHRPTMERYSPRPRREDSSMYPPATTDYSRVSPPSTQSREMRPPTCQPYTEYERYRRTAQDYNPQPYRPQERNGTFPPRITSEPYRETIIAREQEAPRTFTASPYLEQSSGDYRYNDTQHSERQQRDASLAYQSNEHSQQLTPVRPIEPLYSQPFPSHEGGFFTSGSSSSQPQQPSGSYHQSPASHHRSTNSFLNSSSPRQRHSYELQGQAASEQAREPAPAQMTMPIREHPPATRSTRPRPDPMAISNFIEDKDSI